MTASQNEYAGGNIATTIEIASRGITVHQRITLHRVTKLRHSNRVSTARAIPRLAILSLLLASPLAGAERMTRFVAQPGSKVSIKGGNDIHEFDIQGTEIQGEAEFTVSFPATVTPGKTLVRIEGFIPVCSLQYGAGNAMDKALYHHLKEQTNPRVLFSFREMALKAAPNTNGAPFVFDGQAELVVAGVTNQISMPVQVLPLGDNKLKLSGNTSVKMSDFGIVPPKFGSGGVIKYQDKVEVSVEWLVRRDPAAADKDKP
jgi:hypothetical protein